MTYINNLGDEYLKEYKDFGDKIIAENKKLLGKNNIKSPIFNQAEELNNKQKELKNKQHETLNFENNLFEPTSLAKNETLMNIRFSSGILNTAYKNSIKYSTTLNNNNSNEVLNCNEFLSSLEETDGTDDNDDLENFLKTEYKQGLHINGGGYTYYENGSGQSTEAVNANLSGSYKSKNDKLTMSYGGAFEYENTKQKPEGTKDIDKNISGILMAKYKADKMTYAGGGTAFIYDNDTKLYNIYTGIVHNESGISATLIRKIQVVKDSSGQNVVSNKTDVKLNIIKPKPAGDFPNIIPDIPSPDAPKEAESIVKNEENEVKDIVSKNEKYGFSMDVELSTSSESDEYGVVFKYSSLLSKNKNKNKKISVTPFLGIYDYHPNSQEGLKVRSGIEGNLGIQLNDNTNINSTAIIDNKRIMQCGSHPTNTFMATLNTSVSKNNLSANVSTGYINSDSTVKYSFITGSIEYKMKNSSVSLTGGYQDLNCLSENDKILHTGLRYTLTF